MALRLLACTLRGEVRHYASCHVGAMAGLYVEWHKHAMLESLLPSMCLRSLFAFTILLQSIVHNICLHIMWMCFGVEP